MIKYFLGASLLAAFGISACTTSSKVSDRVPANGQPTPPVDLTKDALNFDLYKNEQWKGGSREAELKEFMAQADEVRQAQMHLMKANKSDSAGRVFHAKNQGCYVGTLQMLSSRSADDVTRVGMFKEDVTYPVMARFSNGLGNSGSDHTADVRGFAMKVFHVKDDATGVYKTQDFTSTNSPVPFGKDQAQFVEFMKSVVYPGFLMEKSLAFIAKNFDPVGFNLLHRTVFHKTNSLMLETYWSGHPYLMGSDKSMKFNFRPYPIFGPYSGIAGDKHIYQTSSQYVKSTLKEHPITSDPDYLSKDLSTRDQYGIGFILSVQLDKDSAATPNEDASYEWSEKASPSMPVAYLQLTDPAPNELCDRSQFTPGHHVSQHRPVGNMGRGRIFTYQASTMGRSARKEELRVDEIESYFSENIRQDHPEWFAQ